MEGPTAGPDSKENLEMVAYTYSAPTLDASGIKLPNSCGYLTTAEARAMLLHQREINQVAMYARRLGKSQVRIVGDDSEGEIRGGFRAVTFLHRGITVTARTIFDVQYHYS
jgi:hypothetical protein